MIDTTGWLSLVLITAVLSVQFMFAVRTVRGFVGAILALQAIYWAVSYVGRGVVLYVLQPSPAFGDSLADPRLAGPGYDEALETVLLIPLAGCALYLLVSILTSRRSRASTSTYLRQGSHRIASNMLWLWALGWIGRIVWLLLGPDRLAETLLGLASVGAIGFAIYAPRLHKDRLVLLAHILFGELVWSYLYESKTPLLAMAAALFIRSTLRGWRAATLRRLVIGALLVVPAFALVQTTKFSDSDALILGRSTDRYPDYLEPLIVVLYRFDLLSAATDAREAGPGAWLSPSEFLYRLVQTFIPDVVLGYEKTLSGVSWYRDLSMGGEVSPHSSVSLADGFAAEGFALAGIGGIALGALVLALAVRVSDSLLSSTFLPGIVLALHILASPALFERGILGLAETLSKGLQVAAIGWLALLLLDRPLESTTKTGTFR